ncbi:MAG TPA: hypothetical protein VH327_00250 [Gammaproteobacteria bacterium]|jgi:hypothetical protein|nr:hypothetical protein [Gammaproteobacteria bacterium]
MRRLAPLICAVILSLLTTAQAQACACGCGVFAVGTSSLLPNGTGGTAFLEYDLLNQTQNWSGTSSAPAADNDDKNIRSDFYTAGLQYMFNRDWGVNLEVPYTDRLFITEDGGSLQSFHHDALGDIRVMGMYTGLSDDMSTGLSFGLKLATGDYTYPGLDRDTSIGTGTTNLLLGLYHQMSLNADNTWSGFAQAHYDRAFNSKDGYRPGNELDAAAGAYYSGWQFGRATTLAPVLQLLMSDRLHDTGVNADPPDSGYLRFLAAPGLELDTGRMKFYADVEFPVYQDVNGNQLVAPRAYKLILSYSF